MYASYRPIGHKFELAMPDGTPTEGRFEPLKSSTPKFAHRIRIKDVEEVDAEVIRALTTAKNHNISGAR